MLKDVSVVIPCLNAASTIERCIQSILDADYQVREIICVDDGSIDQSRSLINKLIEKDRRVVLAPIKHGGPAVARNYGASLAGGELLFFVDSDVYLEKNTLSILIEVMSKFDYSVVTPLITPFMNNNIFEKYEDERHKRVFGVTSAVIKLAPTYAFLITKSVFDGTKGFDESFLMAAGEDWDLTCRLTKSGHKIFHCVDAKAYHAHASSMRSIIRRAFFYGREGVKFSIKHNKFYIELFFLIIGVLSPVRALLRRSLGMGFVGASYSASLCFGRLCGIIKYFPSLFKRCG